ncbi:hypothetical protein FNH22_06060 [Fulvivirga sp. M361]|uniref:hypothetical protein n=1 Tax=Fulvivirga sp. M361 TaxID=2594266 RepID=UPI00117B7FB8|nr:hypothetical protein [Fulvivirga sp. M361]TRX60611.1 hypothetical protein FNH22_06060 [Fulvivirga sp. M361]
MKKLLIIILIAGSINGWAQDALQRELFSADVVLKYRSELGLSKQQVDNVKKIHGDQIGEFNSLKWDLDAELVALNKQLKPAQVDERSSLSQMLVIMELESKLKQMKLSTLIKIKNELTEPQQEKLKALRTDKDIKGLNVITPINENPRVMLKVDGTMGENNPLYILRNRNGDRKIPSIDGINTSDIQSVNVLKGEKAKESYGEEGKNGVVIIEMKQ